MGDLQSHLNLVWGMVGLAALTLASLVIIPAPYGRHVRPGFGPRLSARSGWMLMEAPASLVFALIYILGPHAMEAVPLLLLGMWQAHYAYRAFIYPFAAAGGAPMPLLVVGLGFAFNCFNAFLNARWVASLGDYPASWAADPRFVCGVLLFFAGMAINRSADRTLRRLKLRTGDYAIPRGRLFALISCPNYAGEMIMWCGWALAAWSPAGLAFAIYTFANLAPRALSHHRWYRERFPDYPRRRRALVPWLV